MFGTDAANFGKVIQLPVSRQVLLYSFPNPPETIITLIGAGGSAHESVNQFHPVMKQSPAPEAP